MAAFSSFQHSNPFLFDTGLLLDDPNNALFSQEVCQSQTFQNLDQSTKVSGVSNNEVSVLSVTNKNSMDSSSIITDYKHDINHNNNNITQMHTTTPLPKKRNSKEASPNSAQSKDMREMKSKKQRKLKDGESSKKKDEKKRGDDDKEVPIGYIHVRARRGQATDSHSLAERVRRERISERMKLLQTLVPGCEKVTGKALMLDEIINYVQSLQNQVEFLSMKLASVNPMFYDFGMDLESFMISPDQNLRILPSPLPNMQQCNPTTVNNYPILDNNSSINSHLFQQEAQLIPITSIPQGNRQVLWEMDEQRQKIINQSGFSNSLFSFQ